MSRAREHDGALPAGSAAAAPPRTAGPVAGVSRRGPGSRHRRDARRWILVGLRSQRLTLRDGSRRVLECPVSSAANGPGELRDSGCTPRGLHYVRACIGAGLPPGAVLRGRRPTGEIYSPELGRRHPERDWILSRILWLCGCEPGRNRLGRCDTMGRFIYLHGTAEPEHLGRAVSHGCIRLADAAVIQLFALVAPGTPVLIMEDL